MCDDPNKRETVVHERVLSHPVRGYYLAAYACPVGELGKEFVGYYKIFAGPVDGYFGDAPCLVKGIADDVVQDPARAMDLALQGASEQVLNLPHASEFAGLDLRHVQRLAC